VGRIVTGTECRWTKHQVHFVLIENSVMWEICNEEFVIENCANDSRKYLRFMLVIGDILGNFPPASELIMNTDCTVNQRIFLQR
jgi:hypothetical protein